MNLKDCKWGACSWNNRYELLGIVFLVVATILTIIAWDSFGIVAMYIVGLVCIGHKHFCYFGCNCQCHRNGEICKLDESHLSTKGHDKVEKESHKKKEI
jgi:hypothetical protein